MLRPRPADHRILGMALDEALLLEVLVMDKRSWPALD